MWGCFLMSGVKILHFLKDWWKSIPIHQNYTMALIEKKFQDFKQFYLISCIILYNLQTYWLIKHNVVHSPISLNSYTCSLQNLTLHIRNLFKTEWYSNLYFVLHCTLILMFCIILKFLKNLWKWIHTVDFRTCHVLIEYIYTCLYDIFVYTYNHTLLLLF